jgi:hypothetical protein
MTDNTVSDWDGKALDTVGNILNADVSGTLLAGAYRNIGSITNAAGKYAGMASGDALTGMKGGTTLGSIFQGAMDKLLPADQIQNAVEASFGIAANPNPTLLFKGPALRQFNFRWIFYPKNITEATNIDTMIRKIKGYMLPATELSRSAALLKYPKMCLLNFYPWDNGGGGEYGWSDNSIIKIKRCAVTACNVTYSPGTTPSFFANDETAGKQNLPSTIEINMTFHELEYMLADDWDSSLASNVTDAGKYADALYASTTSILGEGNNPTDGSTP